MVMMALPPFSLKWPFHEVASWQTPRLDFLCKWYNCREWLPMLEGQMEKEFLACPVVGCMYEV